MNSIRWVSFLLLFILIACKSHENAEQASLANDNFTIDEIKLKELNGNSVNWEKYRGKTLVINFWATWCKPCLREMPSIQRAQEILKNENVIFLFASDEATGQIEEFKAGYDYNFNYVRAENLVELNIMALPTTFIFNPEGKLVFSEMGTRQWDDKDNIDLILNINKTK